MPAPLLRRLGLPIALALLAACGATAEPVELAAADAARPAVVDSILPIEEALRRFRDGLDAPDSLRGGHTDRDSLVAAFGSALFRADTTALAALLLDRAEFAHLYYPDSHFARAPYELDPALLWFQMQNGTSRGITRALRRFGGGGFAYAGYACEAEPAALGGHRLWEECVVSFRDAAGAERSSRLFGSILERDGRFKFVSYANPL